MTGSWTERDYARHLDTEVRAFIAATLSWFPADAATRDIAAQRRLYDRMCAGLRAPRPAGVAVRDIALPRCRARQYLPDRARGAAAILYLHGGGFVLGGLDSHDDICAELAARTGLDLLSVAYRLQPEHPRSAALDDARAGLAWLAAQGDGRVVLAGDSAGGFLCAALAAAGPPPGLRLLGQVLIYPGLGRGPGRAGGGSMRRHAHAPLLSAADVRAYEQAPGADLPAPLAASDFSQLPPSVTLSAECDPLADDGPAYAAAIGATGGTALALVEPGLVHGHLRARHVSARAARAFDRCVAAISALAEGRTQADALRRALEP